MITSRKNAIEESKKQSERKEFQVWNYNQDQHSSKMIKYN